MEDNKGDHIIDYNIIQKCDTFLYFIHLQLSNFNLNMVYKYIEGALKYLDKKKVEAFCNNQQLFTTTTCLNDFNSFHNLQTLANNISNLSKYPYFNDNDTLDMDALVYKAFIHYFDQKNYCFHGKQEVESFKSLLIHVNP